MDYLIEIHQGDTYEQVGLVEVPEETAKTLLESGIWESHVVSEGTDGAFICLTQVGYVG